MQQPYRVNKWVEYPLDALIVPERGIRDAICCLLHTILFTRAPGPVRPSEATCIMYPKITYAFCSVGDVSRKVDQIVQTIENQYEQTLSMTQRHSMPAYDVFGNPTSSLNSPYGMDFGLNDRNLQIITSGYIIVAFFERKVKKALFGLMSNEEKTYFEKWILPIGITEDGNLEAVETDLQKTLLYITSAIQNITHIPNSMYDFEIVHTTSLDEPRRDGNAYGMGGPTESL